MLFEKLRCQVPARFMFVATLLCIGVFVVIAEESPQEVADLRLIDIPNAKMAEKELLVGGQPASEDLQAMAATGYRTVVNLRSLAEDIGWDEPAEAAALGLQYISIPMSLPEGLSTENAEKLAEVLGEQANYPMVVHCGSGNRVGALFALKAFYIDGKSAEEALDLGREAGLTRLEEAVRKHITEER